MCNVTELQFHFVDKSTTRSKKRGTGATVPVAKARHLYAYMMRLFLGNDITLKAIGAFIYEGCDHTTVLNGITQTKNRLDTREVTQADIDRITALVDNKITQLCLSEYPDTQEAEKTLLEKHFATSLHDTVSTQTSSFQEGSSTPRAVGTSKSSPIRSGKLQLS